MAEAQIIDYVSLQEAVADWLDRDDLTTQIESFIQLVEAEIDRRVQWNTKAASLSISTETTNWPSDMVKPRSLRLVTGSTSADVALTVCTSEQLARHRAVVGASTGRPQFVCYERSGLIQVCPTPDTGYTAEITYYTGLRLGGNNLYASTTSDNYFLIRFPDAYLYGSLAHAERFLQHEEAAATWERKFNEAVTQIQALKDASDFPSLMPILLPVVY